MTQLSFLDPPHNTTPTSRAAAESIADVAPTMEAQVLAHIQSCGQHGATREEIANALGMALQTVCARANGLLHKKRIHDSGRTRKTASGREASVLVGGEL